MGHSCRTGGYQYAQFGSTCRDWNTMVHELGHNLCLGHEQARKDRDEFVHFKGCTGTAPIDMDGDLRGSLYDYASQMHYQCGWCLGGWPRMEGATSCGSDIQQGLSVLDADKLNEFYECSDCLGHRWRPIDALTEADRRDMPRFGETEAGEPLFVCRGHIDGEIAIGKYSLESGACHLPYNGAEHELNTRAQVFVLPGYGGLSIPENESKKLGYRLVNVTELLTGKVKAVPIPSGRTSEAVTSYVAVADIEFGGHRESCIGKVFETDWTTAYFPFQGRAVKTSEFTVVACG